MAFELLGLFSLVTFIGSLLVVPWLIGRLHADYFQRHWQEVDARHRRHPALAVTVWVLRNLVGACLVLAGIGMLVLPGQGLLTMLIGICVMDVPGKRRLLDRLVASPQIQKALNWIRRKQGREEFSFPPRP